MSIDKIVVGVDSTGNGMADAVGDVIDYNIVVTNTGNVTLTGVTVVDPLTGTNVVIGDIGVGETVETAASYAITQADLDTQGGGDGDIDNTATADSNETAPVEDSEAVELVYNPLMSIDKIVVGVDSTGNGMADAVGDVIDYNIVVTNTGNVTLTGVTVVDPLTGTNVVIGDIGVGETVETAASYAITQADLDTQGGGDGDIDNTATADSNETAPVEDSEAVELVYNPNIEVVKLVDVGSGFFDANSPTGPQVNISGGTATFRVELTNIGNVSLTDITLTDVVDGGGIIDLSGYTLVESMAQDGILEVGETAYLEYSMPLTAGQHLNTVYVSTAQGAEDDDPAHYFGLVNDGPGVRTPGGWGHSFKLLSFWDGVDGNEIDAEKDEFPDAELTYAVDSNGDGVIDGSDEAGLLLGDYNRDGLANDGHNIFISLEDALDLVRNETGAKGWNKVDDLGRQAVATWLNYLAGNSINDDEAGLSETDAEHWMNTAIDWLLENADANNDGNFSMNGAKVRAREDAWYFGGQILDALDEYNNFGTVDGVINAHDADDVVFVSALSSFVDDFQFV